MTPTGSTSARASMARKLYVSGNMGVGAFRKNYGGARNDGVCRFHHAIGSGSVARAILKQLEAVGVVEKGPKGRRITPLGSVISTASRAASPSPPKRRQIVTFSRHI